MSTKQYFLIVFTLVLTILGAFYSGFFLKNLLTNNPETLETPKNMMPYFSDQIIIVTKDKPHLTLIAFASRFSKDNISYTHRQKVFYFNGKEWQSESANTISEELKIADTSIIPTWNVVDDRSRILKQSINGVVQVDNNNIEFDVPLITNELGVRSVPSYTVYKSEADGELTVNGEKHESYVLYDRTYSYNAEIGLISTTNPIGINTHWVAFWDIDGNFYNVDETTIDDNDKGPYKSHSIAIFKDKDEKVQKSFTLDIQKNGKKGYQINILEKINRSMTVNFLNSINKNPTNQTVDNQTGQLEGEVKLENGKTIKGFGIYEYIYQ